VQLVPRKLKLLVCLAIWLVSLHAGVVHDTSAVLTGTRWIGSSGGVIDGGGSAYDDLMLTWNIVALPNSTYQYTYLLTSHEGPPMNDVILESDGCNTIGTDAATCLSNPTVEAARALAVYENWTSLQLANAIDGVNFVDLPKSSIQTIVISFVSPGAPVWGDVYLAAGNQYVFNIGNLDHLDPNATDFIAVPGNLLGTAPEPSTLLLAGVALTALGLMRRRRGP
jgi:hypothetical protein